MSQIPFFAPRVSLLLCCVRRWSRQRYSGNITIVPKLRVSEMIGLRAFCNPSNDEMSHYIIGT